MKLLYTLLASSVFVGSTLFADLPEVKQEAKDTVYSAIYELLSSYTNQVDRYRALYQDDATAIAKGQAVLDTLDASYNSYAAQIDACETEQEVYDILGSFTNPSPPS